MTDNDLKREYKLPPNAREASLYSPPDVKLRLAPSAYPLRGPSVQAQTVEEKVEAMKERKALLKAQAAMLIARGD